MILRLFRNDGSTVPATAEYVEVADDGALGGWRAVAPVVGWFAGPPGTTSYDALRDAVDTLGDVPTSPPPPGAAVETLELTGRDPLDVSGVGDDGPLAALVARARTLLDETLLDHPRAALALETGPFRLVHRGPDPLVLDLAAVTVQVAHWRGYYEPAGSATEVLGGERVEAGPGWTLELPDAAPPGGDVTTYVTVDLAVVSGDDVVAVQVQHLPAIAEPAGT